MIIATREIRDHDVLLGRSKTALHHIGNISLKAVMDVRLDGYLALGKSRSLKTRMTQEVLDSIEETGGRFLRKEEKDCWTVVDSKVAREKVAHSFRDGLKLRPVLAYGRATKLFTPTTSYREVVSQISKDRGRRITTRKIPSRNANTEIGTDTSTKREHDTIMSKQEPKEKRSEVPVDKSAITVENPAVTSPSLLHSIVDSHPSQTRSDCLRLLLESERRSMAHHQVIRSLVAAQSTGSCHQHHHHHHHHHHDRQHLQQQLLVASLLQLDPNAASSRISRIEGGDGAGRRSLLLPSLSLPNHHHRHHYNQSFFTNTATTAAETRPLSIYVNSTQRPKLPTTVSSSHVATTTTTTSM